MSIIQLTDVTLAAKEGKQHALTFKETIEIAKKLDGLNISTIMLPSINGSKTEALLVRTIAGVLKNSATATMSIAPERAKKTIESISKISV